MLEALFWVLIGAFIGWHVSQPTWAKVLQEKVLRLFKKGE